MCIHGVWGGMFLYFKGRCLYMHVFLCGGILFVLCGDRFLSVLFRDGFACGGDFVYCEGAVFWCVLFCRSGITVSYLVIVVFMFILIMNIWGSDFIIPIQYFYLSHFFSVLLCFFFFKKIHWVFLLMLLKILFHLVSL